MQNGLPFRYMAISGESVCPEPVPERINRLLELGVPAVQLRDKHRSDRTRFDWLRRVDPARGFLIVNGRWDLAVLADADGVHCPGNGVPLTELKKLNHRNFFYGVSTHTLDEILEAETAGADYVTFGPVFPTPSKPDRTESDIPGLDGLNEVTDRTDIPVLALGGIGADDTEACLEAGAYGIAGIRALFGPRDPSNAWTKIESKLEEFHGGSRLNHDPDTD